VRCMIHDIDRSDGVTVGAAMPLAVVTLRWAASQMPDILDGVHPCHSSQFQEAVTLQGKLTSNFRTQLLCGFPCPQPLRCELILADAVNEGTYHRAHPIGCEVE
jgi:hypothetical protein